MMDGVMVEREKMPEWAREVLLYEVRVINKYLKSLDEDSKKKNIIKRLKRGM